MEKKTPPNMKNLDPSISKEFDKKKPWTEQRVTLYKLGTTFPNLLVDCLDAAYVAGLDVSAQKISEAEERVRQEMLPRETDYKGIKSYWINKSLYEQKISEAYNKGVGDGRSQEAAICYKHQTTVDEAVQKREEEILVEVKKAIGYTSVAHQVENPSDDYVAGASDQYLTIRNKVEAITSHPPQERCVSAKQYHDLFNPLPDCLPGQEKK